MGLNQSEISNYEQIVPIFIQIGKISSKIDPKVL